MYEFLTVKTDAQTAVVANLANTIWREYYKDLIGDDQIEYMLKKYQSSEAVSRAVAEGTMYYVVRCGGANVGYFALKAENDGLFLSKLYMLNWARGQGAGSESLKFIEQIARSLKLDKIYLTVNKRNEISVSVYLKWGFEKKQETVTDIGGGFVMDDYIMEKSL